MQNLPRNVLPKEGVCVRKHVRGTSYRAWTCSILLFELMTSRMLEEFSSHTCCSVTFSRLQMRIPELTQNERMEVLHAPETEA